MAGVFNPLSSPLYAQQSEDTPLAMRRLFAWPDP